jgi:hypothetical protein
VAVLAALAVLSMGMLGPARASSLGQHTDINTKPKAAHVEGSISACVGTEKFHTTHRMKSPIQKHHSYDCQNLYVCIGKIDMVKIPMFLHGSMYVNTLSKTIKHIVKHRQNTWSTIIKTHCHTS